jgi:hypothetical protein
MGEVRYRTPYNFVDHYEFCKTRSSESHILNKGVIHILPYFLYLSDVQSIGPWYVHRNPFGVLWTEAQWKQSFRYGCKLISKYAATCIGLFLCNYLLRNLQIILWCVCELCENRRTEGHANGCKLNNVCTVKQYHILKIKKLLRITSDFRLTPRSRWELNSSGLLRREQW